MKEKQSHIDKLISCRILIVVYLFLCVSVSTKFSRKRKRTQITPIKHIDGLYIQAYFPGSEYKRLRAGRRVYKTIQQVRTHMQKQVHWIYNDLLRKVYNQKSVLMCTSITLMISVIFSFLVCVKFIFGGIKQKRISKEKYHFSKLLRTSCAMSSHFLDN